MAIQMHLELDILSPSGIKSRTIFAQHPLVLHFNQEFVVGYTASFILQDSPAGRSPLEWTSEHY
jgi:hypothetical protein